MTAGNKKRASGRKAQTRTKRRTEQKDRRKKAVKQQENFTSEVVLWIVVAVSILLFISNFGIGGTIGNAVSRFFFGIFGLIAYIFPVLLLVGTFFTVSNKGSRIAAVKMVAVVLFVMFLCMFMELIVHGSEVQTAPEAYRYSYEHRFGGGFIGGLLTWLICPNFGLIGSYVIDAIVLIISLVLITERSALRGVQKGSKKVYESAKISNERHRERAEQRREERELRRMDRQGGGGCHRYACAPGTAEEPSDEMSELTAETPQTELPEIREEKHVTLTSGTVYEEESAGMPPSAFSDEALEVLSAIPQEKAVQPYAETGDFARASVKGQSFSQEQRQTEELAAQTARRGKTPEAERAEDVSDIEHEIQIYTDSERAYVFPPLNLLAQPPKKAGDSGLICRKRP